MDANKVQNADVKITARLDANSEWIHAKCKDCHDFREKEILLPIGLGIRAKLMWFDGLANEELLNEEILDSLSKQQSNRR